MDKNLGWLMVDNARLLRRAFDERVRTTGMTGPQARLLLALERTPGENQAFHAERLEVEPITLCRMVDRMEGLSNDATTHPTAAPACCI